MLAYSFAIITLSLLLEILLTINCQKPIQVNVNMNPYDSFDTLDDVFMNITTNIDLNQAFTLSIILTSNNIYSINYSYIMNGYLSNISFSSENDNNINPSLNDCELLPGIIINNGSVLGFNSFNQVDFSNIRFVDMKMNDDENDYYPQFVITNSSGVIISNTCIITNSTSMNSNDLSFINLQNSNELFLSNVIIDSNMNNQIILSNNITNIVITNIGIYQLGGSSQNIFTSMIIINNPLPIAENSLVSITNMSFYNDDPINTIQTLNMNQIFEIANYNQVILSLMIIDNMEITFSVAFMNITNITNFILSNNIISQSTLNINDSSSSLSSFSYLINGYEIGNISLYGNLFDSSIFNDINLLNIQNIITNSCVLISNNTLLNNIGSLNLLNLNSFISSLQINELVFIQNTLSMSFISISLNDYPYIQNNILSAMNMEYSDYYMYSLDDSVFINNTCMDFNLLKIMYNDNILLAFPLMVYEIYNLWINNLTLQQNIFNQSSTLTSIHDCAFIDTSGISINTNNINLQDNILSNFNLISMSMIMNSFNLINSFFDNNTMINSCLFEVIDEFIHGWPVIDPLFFDSESNTLLPLYRLILIYNNTIQNSMFNQSNLFTIGSPYIIIFENVFENLTLIDEELVTFDEFKPMKINGYSNISKRNLTIEQNIFNKNPLVYDIFNSSLSYLNDTTLVYCYRISSNIYNNINRYQSSAGRGSIIQIADLKLDQNLILIDNNIIENVMFNCLQASFFYGQNVKNISFILNDITNINGEVIILGIYQMKLIDQLNMVMNNFTNSSKCSLLSVRSTCVNLLNISYNYINFLGGNQMLFHFEIMNQTGLTIFDTNIIINSMLTFYSKRYCQVNLIFIEYYAIGNLNTTTIFQNNYIDNFTTYVNQTFIKTSYKQDIFIFSLGNSSLIIKNNTFTNINAILSGGLWDIGAYNISFFNNIFMNINTYSAKGIVITSLSYYLTIFDCLFYNNSVVESLNGGKGIIYQSYDYILTDIIYVTIMNSTFINNYGGSVGIFSTEQLQLSIQIMYNLFMNNYGNDQSSISFMDIYLANSYCENNQIIYNEYNDYETNSFIFIYAKNTTGIMNFTNMTISSDNEFDISLIEENSFINDYIDNTMIQAIMNTIVLQDNIINIDNNIMQDNISSALFMEENNIQITLFNIINSPDLIFIIEYCIFNINTNSLQIINADGGIYIFDQLNVSNLDNDTIVLFMFSVNKQLNITIQNSLFQNICRLQNNSCITSSSQSQSSIDMSKSLIWLDNEEEYTTSANIMIINTTFTNITKPNSCILLDTSNTIISIINVKFTNITTFRGIISSNDTNAKYLQIINSTFYNNNASYSTPCIYIQNLGALTIYNNTFINNNLTDLGAIIFSDSYIQNPTILANNNIIANNIMSVINFGNQTISQNLLLVSSNPKGANMSVKLQDYQLNYITYYYCNYGNISVCNGNNQTLVFNNVSSFDFANITLLIYLIDQYGQPTGLINYNQNYVNLFAYGTTIISSANCTIIGCYITDNPSFIISNSTGNIVNMLVSFYAKENMNQTVSIIVNLRDCESGEMFDIVTNTCVLCPAGTYSLTPSQICTNCPPEANCTGGSVILLDKNYWRANDSSIILACPHSGVCLGNYSECEKGYIGPTCIMCDIYNNYEIDFHFACTPCMNSTSIIYFTNLAKSVTFELILVIISIWAVTNFEYLEITREGKQRLEIYSYSKISLFFVQVVGLFSHMGSQIFDPTYGMFSNIGLPAIDLFFHDFICTLKGYGIDPIEAFYTRLYFIVFSPVIRFIIIFLIILALSFKKINFKYVPIIISSMLAFEQPSTFQEILAYISCSSIDDGINTYYYHTNYPTYPCYTQYYWEFIIFLAVPGLLFWGLIPIILLSRLRKNKNRLESDYTKKNFGYFIYEYKKKNYYWGLLTIIFLNGCSVLRAFLIEHGANLTLSLFVGTMWYTLSFINMKPFKEDKYNRLSIYMNYTFMATSYAISFYYDNSVSWLSRTTEYLCIVINFFMFAVMIYKLFEYYIDTLHFKIYKIYWNLRYKRKVFPSEVNKEITNQVKNEDSIINVQNSNQNSDKITTIEVTKNSNSLNNQIEESLIQHLDTLTITNNPQKSLEKS